MAFLFDGLSAEEILYQNREANFATLTAGGFETGTFEDRLAAHLLDEELTTDVMTEIFALWSA